MGYLKKQNHPTITMLINAHLMSAFFFFCGLMAYLWTFKNITYRILLDERAKAWSISCDSLLAPWPCCTFSLQRRLLCLVSSSMYSLTFLFVRLHGVPKLWAVTKITFLLPIFCALHVSFQSSSYRFSVNLFCEPTHFLL